MHRAGSHDGILNAAQEVTLIRNSHAGSDFASGVFHGVSGIHMNAHGI